jgi:DNA mismatch repair protein MutL
LGRSGPLATGGEFPGIPGAAASAAGRGATYELSARAPDRQAVSSWFTPGPAGGTPTIPDSVGRVEPPEWSRSLPGQFQFAAADAFDEFGSPPAPLSTSPATSRDVSGSSAAPGATASALRERHAGPELAPGPLKAIQVHDSYLIAETEDGMVVIDQHALHERILYEELRQRVAGGKAESQGLLVPEPVHLSADEAAAILEHRELLAELGLDVEPFGGDTVLVRSTPVMLTHLAPERLVRDLAEHVHTQPIPPSRDALVAELLHMVACKAAVKAGDRLSPEEIEALLERRHLVADSHHCPHGRPTALVFTKAELEKQFGRI